MELTSDKLAVYLEDGTEIDEDDLLLEGVKGTDTLVLSSMPLKKNPEDAKISERGDDATARPLSTQDVTCTSPGIFIYTHIA